jgi:LysR family glycine cleavage system transcriptional activator
MSDTHGPDPLRGIPLEALRGFEAAARLLNFTRAAEELHLTQSAVSREIRSLEDRLGLRLFERSKGGLRLTQAGVALREDVSTALAAMRRGIERVAGETSRRSFVVVTNRSMLSDWLWARVAD